MAVSSTFAHFFRFALCILICNRSNVKEKVFCGLYKSFLCLKLETKRIGEKAVFKSTCCSGRGLPVLGIYILQGI